jgi:hypothetical protein
MADDLTFPVAYCPTCDEKGPVVIEEFPAEEFGEEFIAIYCPQCEDVINLDRDISVEWFTEEEVGRVTGWKVVRDG